MWWTIWSHSWRGYWGDGLPPARPEQPYWVDIAIRVAGGLVGALGLGIFGLAAFAVLSSRFSSNPFADPHGYGLVFGMLLAVPFGLLAAGTLPLAFTRGRRLRA